MRPPILEPTRMSRASTVPEPWSAVSRWNQLPAYTAAAAIAATTRTMMTTRLRLMITSPSRTTLAEARG